MESVVDRGFVGEEHITGEYESRIFGKWTPGCTRQDHPTIIQVLLESGKDKDNTGHGMPSLVYVSREKKKNVPHKFQRWCSQCFASSIGHDDQRATASDLGLRYVLK